MTQAAVTHERGERIVVGVDGSECSRRALAWAARQAELTGARLVVVTVWEFPVNLGWSLPWPEDFDPAADAASILDECVTDVLGSAPAVELETAVREGHPAPVLTQFSADATLVVVGSRGHGEFTGMLLGSVSEFLTTHAHCPVVVVRDGGAAGEQPS